MIPKVVIFILRPFAKPIRYGALKIMKKMRHSDDPRPTIATSGHILDDIVLPSVFKTFHDTRFRELANFGQLSIVEHDRIFNELEVAGICMVMDYLDIAKTFAKDGDFHFWRDVGNGIPERLQEKLISFGVDSVNAQLMKQLIEMRHEEYSNLAEHVRRANDSEGVATDFKSLSSEMKQIAVAIQTTAVGATDHIRRGEMREGDPLIKYLAAWLAPLQSRVGRFFRKL